MVQLATADQVESALAALLRRDVRVKALNTTPPKLTMGGLYHTGDGNVIASVASDIEFAAYSGASFSIIPADVAEECVQKGELDEGMRENFAEVLNVGSRLFMPPAGGRIALKASIFPPAALPPQAIGAPAGPGRGANYQITIDDYGVGMLCLRVLG